MNKQQFFTFLYVFLIIGLLLFMIFMVFWLKNEGGQCARDPIKYFENKNENLECQCIDYENIGIGNYIKTNELKT